MQTVPSWTAGRQVITGVVLWSKSEVNRKFHNVTFKGELLLSDGRKLWTTLPARPPEILFQGEPWEVQMHHDIAAGDTVTMTVTVTPRDDDMTRANGSRPKLQAFRSASNESLQVIAADSTIDSLLSPS